MFKRFWIVWSPMRSVSQINEASVKVVRDSARALGVMQLQRTGGPRGSAGPREARMSRGVVRTALWTLLWLGMALHMAAGTRLTTTTTEFPEGFAENGTNNGQF